MVDTVNRNWVIVFPRRNFADLFFSSYLNVKRSFPLTVSRLFAFFPRFAHYSRRLPTISLFKSFVAFSFYLLGNSLIYGLLTYNALENVILVLL